MTRLKLLAGVAVFITLSFLGLSAASAAIIGEIFLAGPNGALAGSCNGESYCPGAYFSIDATLNTVTDVATFTFTGLTASGTDATPKTFEYLMMGAGGGNILGLVLNTTGITVNSTNITGAVSSFTQPSWAQKINGGFTFVIPGNDTPCSKSGTVNPGEQYGDVGCYNMSLNVTDSKEQGTNNAISSITFTLTLADAGGEWDCLKSVDCANAVLDTTNVNFGTWLNSKTGTQVSSSSWAEAHVTVCSPTDDVQTNCGIITAWAGGAATTDVQVPEPGTLMLLGSGLLLTGTLVRRFRK